MIEVDRLTQRYGRYTAVRDVSFSLAAGEVVGFLGPNGAGKSTTLKVLAAYLAPSQGRVVVGGHDVGRAPGKVREVLGYLPEHCPLYEEMRVRGFLEFVARVRGIGRDARAGAVGRAVERCRLEDVVDRPISELSKGYRQRTGIAAALLHDPPILILDEPTHGLDPNQVLEVRELVREVGRERTVFFSSHILSEVEATCRRVVVLHQGRVVADDAVDALKARATGGAVRVRFEEASDDLEEQLAGVEGLAAVSAVPGEAGAFVVRPTPGAGDPAARVFRFAKDAGRTLVELAPVRPSLEDVFAGLTARTEEAAAAGAAAAQAPETAEAGGA